MLASNPCQPNVLHLVFTMFTKLNKENCELPNSSHVSGLCDPELLTQGWLHHRPVLHWFPLSSVSYSGLHMGFPSSSVQRSSESPMQRGPAKEPSLTGLCVVTAEVSLPRAQLPESPFSL